MDGTNFIVPGRPPQQSNGGGQTPDREVVWRAAICVAAVLVTFALSVALAIAAFAVPVLDAASNPLT